MARRDPWHAQTERTAELGKLVGAQITKEKKNTGAADHVLLRPQ